MRKPCVFFVFLVLFGGDAVCAQAIQPAAATKDRQVIRFFLHHPRLARTPAGELALWTVLGHVEGRLRTLQAAREEPATWLAAVDVVGRYFGADVAAWERSCSQPSSEGGYGRWVPNTQGSGAGGWLQFMQGTFDSVIDDAIRSARAKGMVVLASARSWYSPLGQALAGAQMLADGRRGEWAGWGC